MRFKRQRNTSQAILELTAGCSSICRSKLFGHERGSKLAVLPQRPQHLQNPRDVVHQGDVDGLDTREEWKAAIGNHQCVGMPDSAEQRTDVWVEDASQ